MQRTNYAALICRSILLFLFILNSSTWSAQAQSLPPAKHDGFVYKNYPVDPDTIVVEAFFDPVCPDSRDAWPPLKQALEYYSPHVSFVLHLLPLPYHDNAYATSRALHIVNIHNSSSTFCLLEQFFKHQEKFYNAHTQNLSRTSVVNEIVKFSAEAVGESYSSAIQSGFTDRKTDLLTRVSFKYSTSRGVYGTPTFFVNGFALPDAGSPLVYNGWRKVIDPLITGKGKKSDDTLHFFL
ncbi:Thioredoxin superfamily protein [Melia azedarach]|uniref:Thioredoxin superfamily protein n=1 Tax=Melia azedarach TaxID=155640 RepID=A0ACC1WT18_MELAZ|nr:Thioredoxin superfamily protein [Melia azedarach]